jgi:hypothetical protein
VLRTNVDLGTDHRLADAAGVRAMASGSQHKTINATSHRMMLSVSAPTNSAT